MLQGVVHAMALRPAAQGQHKRADTVGSPTTAHQHQQQAASARPGSPTCWPPTSTSRTATSSRAESVEHPTTAQLQQAGAQLNKKHRTIIYYDDAGKPASTASGRRENSADTSHSVRWYTMITAPDIHFSFHTACDSGVLVRESCSLALCVSPCIAVMHGESSIVITDL